MTWRKTLAYWMLFVVLAGYYAAFEREAPAVAEPETKREKILPVFRDEIRALILRRGDRMVRAELQDKRWRVVSPEGVAIPSDLVAALIETLAEKQEAEVVEESPDPEALRAFGLDEPTSTIEVELVRGESRTIEVGQRNPTRTAVYARTSGSPRILLAGLNIQYYGDLLLEAARPRAVPASSARQN